MKLRETKQGTVISVYVKPKSSQFRLKVEDDELVVFCRGTPVKGKVNRELIKELSRLFKRRMKILSGYTSRHKKIFITDIKEEEFREILSTCISE